MTQSSRSLPPDLLARFFRIAELIEAKGPHDVGAPHVKHLSGKVWEMRMKGRAGIGRALYQAAGGQRLVVVRVFVKKTRKTPRHEITLAEERAKQIT